MYWSACIEIRPFWQETAISLGHSPRLLSRTRVVLVPALCFRLLDWPTFSQSQATPSPVIAATWPSTLWKHNAPGASGHLEKKVCKVYLLPVNSDEFCAAGPRVTQIKPCPAHRTLTLNALDNLQLILGHIQHSDSCA